NWCSIWPVLSFLGGETAALGGIWWVAGLTAIGETLTRVALNRRGPRHVGEVRVDVAVSEDRAGLLYLLCLWGVIWTACLAASLLGETEVNWIVPGYIALVVLIGLRIDRLLARGGVVARNYVAAWCLCLIAIIMIHHTEW